MNSRSGSHAVLERLRLGLVALEVGLHALRRSSRTAVGPMMNRLRNSARPASTWLGGTLVRPSALRVMLRTTKILVKHVHSSSSGGRHRQHGQAEQDDDRGGRLAAVGLPSHVDVDADRAAGRRDRRGDRRGRSRPARRQRGQAGDRPASGAACGACRGGRRSRAGHDQPPAWRAGAGRIVAASAPRRPVAQEVDASSARSAGTGEPSRRRAAGCPAAARASSCDRARAWSRSGRRLLLERPPGRSRRAG